jgi:hypothetical protein
MRSNIMNAVTCRDCGYLLEPTVRGCPQCALNVEAETMIDRFIWKRLLPSVIIIAALVVVAFYLLR